MNTATVINEGSAQSIRLPEQVRVEGSEVYVKQVGRSILLIPTDVDRWQMFVKLPMSRFVRSELIGGEE